jgi:hypothetical protein
MDDTYTSAQNYAVQSTVNSLLWKYLRLLTLLYVGFRSRLSFIRRNVNATEDFISKIFAPKSEQQILIFEKNEISIEKRKI